MKKSPLSRPQKSESHSRNAFDRSYQNNFTFSNGQLIPTFCKFVLGNSHVRLNQKSFFRADVVTAPAFPQMPVYTDYFFVPMSQLLTCYLDFKTQIDDRQSSSLNVPKRLPAITSVVLKNALDSLSTSVDDGGYRSSYGALRLLDMLDYGIGANNVIFNDRVVSSMPYVGNINPFALCAYQKIYYDHYRNTSYESNYVKAYNLDWLAANPTVSNPTAADVKEFLKIHYVNAKKDFFTAIYPSMNFIQGNPLINQLTPPSNILGMTSAPLLESTYFDLLDEEVTIPGGAQVVPSSPAIGGSTMNTDVQTIFTLQNLRVAFMLEKMFRVSAFAPQHVKDQFKARFGYVPRSANARESVRLGSFKNIITIGEVTSTAQTGSGTGQRLGSVSGKGVGASDFQKPISYDVPEDGFIMAVSYVLPEFSYDSDKIDSVHQKFVPEDFFLPEFEKAGLQPIYRKNLSLFDFTDTEAGQLKANNIILGYQNREQEIKTSVNTNHGVLCRTKSHEAFVVHSNKSRVRNISSDYDGVTMQYFKNTPADIDDLFVVSFDGTEQSDQFFGQVVNSFACIQDKPVFGLEI